MADILRLRAQGASTVEETWQRFVPSARLASRDTRRMAFDWTSVSLPGLSVVEYELTASIRSAIDPEGQIMACRVAARGAQVWSDDRDLDARLPWLTDAERIQARWDPSARVRALIFDPAAVQQTARQLSGDDDLVVRVQDATPRSVAAARRWEHAFRYTMGALLDAGDADPVATDDDLMQAELARHAIVTTLAVFPTTFADASERTAQRRAAPRVVRTAIAFMEAHAAEPITVDDAAAAAAISTRGLQYAFRRALGVTPTEYLRTIRLAAAHEDLRRGMGPTVAVIARRWGFTNPARFAQHYRGAYGRSPGETFRGV